MGTKLPQEKRAQPPAQFLAHVYCGQTAAWIKMPLGMEVGLSPDHIVLEGNPAPPPKKEGTAPPPQKIGSCLLWPNGLMDQDANWYEGMPRFRPLCVTWGPSSPTKKGTSPNVRPMSIVAKQSPISTTAEFGAPQQISTGFASWLRYCTDVAQRLQDIWPSLGLV